MHASLHVCSLHAVFCMQYDRWFLVKWMVPIKNRKFYYKKFVKGFSQIAISLFKLLQNNITYIWTVDQEEAFSELKR